LATIRPFAAIRYSRHKGIDFSQVIAPPYDVLDESGKAALQAKHPHNIVTIDLPHLPPKTVGPDETYAKANTTLQSWLTAGILEKDGRAALYPYTQSFDHNGRTFHRRGFLALVRLSPFGKGEVVPHEKTYASAIEDRLKLTRATGVQLSPIFGLFSDPKNEVTNTLYKSVSKPEMTATLQGVKNDLWSVTDSEVETKVIDLMGRKPIYIADGHHRYTMALAYQKEQIEKAGGKLPPAHPANFCLFHLVSMQDDGLLILPTHRLIGGLKSFEPKAFIQALGSAFKVTETNLAPNQVAMYIDEVLPKQPPHSFGLYHAAEKRLYQLTLTNLDLLKPFEPNQSDAWRRLDVAILQRYLIEEILQPKFAAGSEITKGYTAISEEVVPKTTGNPHQIALLLRSTPLHALEELGKHNEVMPQKSTYFFPKIATGLVINSVR
jgi:uncharacterized protein (DUF1015 family)